MPYHLLKSIKNSDSYTKIFTCDSWFSFKLKDTFKTIILKVSFQLEENMKIAMMFSKNFWEL